AVRDQAPKGVRTIGAIERRQRGDRAASLGQLEHRADTSSTALRRSPEEIAAAVLDHTRTRISTIGAVEGGERGDGAAALDQLEHRAETSRAAFLGSAEEIAAAVFNQSGAGVPSVDFEGGECRDRAAARFHLENRAVIIGAAGNGRAEEIAAAVLE